MSRRSSAESISSLEKYGCSKPAPVPSRPTRVTAARRFQCGATNRRARPYCLNQTFNFPAAMRLTRCNERVTFVENFCFTTEVNLLYEEQQPRPRRRQYPLQPKENDD